MGGIKTMTEYCNQMGQNGTAGSQVYIGDFPPLYPYQGALPLINYPNTTHICFSPGPHPIYPIKMRKVGNGFIVLSNGIEYVFSDTKEMLMFIEKEMKV